MKKCTECGKLFSSWRSGKKCENCVMTYCNNEDTLPFGCSNSIPDINIECRDIFPSSELEPDMPGGGESAGGGSSDSWDSGSSDSSSSYDSGSSSSD
jgi:hypothetical protein